ncbi:MAG TPA: hypothetical protein VIF62_19080 [Labilithrix sp.]|jgi:hypothetical protein
MVSMRTAGLLLSIVLAGCASRTDDATSASDQDLSGCRSGVSGWDCGAAGETCARACLTADESSRAYVTFDVGGKTLDSRDVPFDPVAAPDHVLLYGCTLWDGDVGKQGLDVEYKRIVDGDAADRRSDFEDYVDVAIDDFHGPGSYRASPTYVASNAAQASGRIYGNAGGCGVEVDADEEGGIHGTIACDPMKAPGATLALSGEFVCPATTLAPLMSRLPM